MLKYIQEIFRADSPSSFARYATAVCVLASICNLTYLVLKNHALPEAASLVALGAWMTAPYAIGKAAAAFDRSGSGSNSN